MYELKSKSINSREVAIFFSDAYLMFVCTIFIVMFVVWSLKKHFKFQVAD